MKFTPDIRSQIYAILSMGFKKPFFEFYYECLCTLTKNILDSLNGCEFNFTKLSTFLESEEDIEQDFYYLFYGPGRLLAPPYESVYRSPQRQTMGPWAYDVLGIYNHFNFQLEESFKECPDHITVELEFLAHLANEEYKAAISGDTNTLNNVLTFQEKFLREHIFRWVPFFCNDVIKNARTGFFVNIAEILDKLVKIESSTFIPI